MTIGDREGEPEPKIVVRDRRRIDPVTGSLRPPADIPASEPPRRAEAPVSSEATETLERLQGELTERVADLQRITAEYANYRKRVERDRGKAMEQATALIMQALLPVLDDIERARAHGDLTGGFATVSEHLVTTLSKLGLAAFGDEGDVFDPTWHEAVSHAGSAHAGSADVDEPTCVQILRKGYALGERLIRPALVVVADPAPADTAAESPHASANTADEEAIHSVKGEEMSLSEPRTSARRRRTKTNRRAE